MTVFGVSPGYDGVLLCGVALLIVVPIVLFVLARRLLKSDESGQHLFPPSEPARAAWHLDPTTRHQMRYWDGLQWTARVSDNDIESHDPLS